MALRCERVGPKGVARTVRKGQANSAPCNIAEASRPLKDETPAPKNIRLKDGDYTED